ncbi:hypothetical protein [Peribacillus sp. SI8-4]|uniref:hypothetical protein n=1 Tax=Peribacillus sp. SI8-4 TaxID=3048009 RepID=UPI0025545F19|nr:hypothetical protein [Peribacillus sp. SI8-4]
MSKVTKLDQKERFIEMRAKEVPYVQISQEIGVSKPTLLKWGRVLELEINNRRAIELEYLQDKHCVSKRKRLEFYGEQLDRLYQELQQRDLSDIPTEKLYDMAMKTVASLKQEETPIRFKEEGTLNDSLHELTKTYVEWRG